jgi:hypothetical protein
MHLRRGIVIRSFVRSFCPMGYYFLLVSSFSYWGMGTVEPAARTVYGSSYRWGSEGVPLHAVNGPVLVHYLVVLTGLQTS